MSQKLNSFERFWQELKRRKVVQVITVYVAIAFGILQLVDIIGPSLKWPEWTMTFIIVLLCIGFIIAIFLSWIYDITPAGLRKTKPVSAVKHIDQTTAPTSSGWKIATYVSGLIIVVLVAFNFISRRSLNSDISKLEKSIAVLPFINDSPNDSNQYFINGIMEEILNSLQKIGAFSRVLSRKSVEQFRNNTTKSTPEIAKALNVNFIVEGSGQKYGNKFVLRVQLVTGKNERHLWAKSYDREIMQTTDIISVQSEIAQLIAAELKTTITPEEKQLIENKSTISLTALDFYQKGRDEHKKYWQENFNYKLLDNAVVFYKLALKSDSTFAQAYLGLANARYDLEESYLWRGSASENKDVAIKEFRKALEINPNYSDAYDAISNVFLEFKRESIEGIKYKLKAIELEKGPNLAYLLASLGQTYETLGFNENAIDIYNQLLPLTNDTLQYYKSMSGPYYAQKNWEESIRWAKKILEKDPNHLWAHAQLATIYYYLGKDDSSSYHIERFIGISENRLDYLLWGVIPFRVSILLNHGDKEQASAILESAIDFLLKMIKSGLSSDYPQLAKLFLLKGEQEKAIEYLKKNDFMTFNNGWYIEDMEINPIYQNIRSDVRFQKILNSMKSNWQKEHEKVRVWLVENNLLKI
jgi:TolB-like protein